MNFLYYLLIITWSWKINVETIQGRNHLRKYSNQHQAGDLPLMKSNALSFYRSQNVLGRSKLFVSEQKFIYILYQSQTFCAIQKDDLHSVKLVFVSAQKFLKRH